MNRLFIKTDEPVFIEEILSFSKTVRYSFEEIMEMCNNLLSFGIEKREIINTLTYIDETCNNDLWFGIKLMQVLKED